MNDYSEIHDMCNKRIIELELLLRATKDELNKPCRQCAAELKKQGELLRELGAERDRFEKLEIKLMLERDRYKELVLEVFDHIRSDSHFIPTLEWLKKVKQALEGKEK